MNGLAKPVEGWEKRVEELAKPEHWEVKIRAHVELLDSLTPEEWERLQKKISMVWEAAKYMLAGMVKGTVKYSSDDWTLERWMAHLIDEGADQMNYQILLFNKWRDDKKEADEEIERVKQTWKNAIKPGIAERLAQGKPGKVDDNE